MERLLCAVFDSERGATRAVERLLHSGSEPSVVDAVIHRGSLAHDDMPYAGESSFRRAVIGALIGGTLGGILGGVVLGHVALIGPGAAALALFVVGSLYGAIAGAITGRDADKPAVEELASQLRNGRVMVTVDLAGDADVGRIEVLLRSMGAHDLRVA
jgi:outer membrane lipoprotein SlyB